MIQFVEMLSLQEGKYYSGQQQIKEKKGKRYSIPGVNRPTKFNADMATKKKKKTKMYVLLSLHFLPDTVTTTRYTQKYIKKVNKIMEKLIPSCSLEGFIRKRNCMLNHVFSLLLYFFGKAHTHIHTHT